jgi:hypothetical protein
MAHKTVTKAEAKRLGLKTYDGKPCKYGHTERFVKGDKCAPCNVERTRKFREKAKTAKTGNSHTKSKVAETTVVYAREVEPKTTVPETVVVRMVEPTPPWRSYATKITAAWRQAVESIVETGKLLIEAKAKVDPGNWLKLAEELPFGERTAQRLMEIARHPILSNPTHGSHLPPSWRTLYELSKIDDQVLLARIEDHSVHPGMERKHVALITGEIHPKTKLRRMSKADERLIEQAEEIKRMTAHIREIESAREFGLYIEIKDEDDDAAVAEEIFERMGSERVSRLIAELQRLLGAASEAA